MVIVVLVAVNKSQLEHGLAQSQMTVSAWAVASRPRTHVISTQLHTRASEAGCPFSSRVTRAGDEEAQVESSVETRVSGRLSVDSASVSSQKDYPKPGVVEMVMLPTALEREGP